MSVHLKSVKGLSDEDREVLRRLAGNLNLLADLTHADVLLYCPVEGEAQVAAEGRPEPVPSLYEQSMLGRRLTRAEAPSVFKVLFDGRLHQHFGGVLLRGTPVMREVFAIRNPHGRIIAALASEMPMLEHERLRRRAAIFRQAIARARELILSGRLVDGEKLGRLGVHDGVMVIDGRGQIHYISAVAEHLYRRLGYAETLVNTQLSDLDTNEYVCFRAMELGTCLEQRVEEQGEIWIKRVIPLLSMEEGGLLNRLRGTARIANGAIIVIEDVTDEVRKEQELKIKSAMIQEIHHRVKNNLQTIAALLRLQARKTTSDEVAEQLRQTVSRILSIAVIHEFLSKDEQAVINIHEVSNRILDEVTHGTLDPEKKVALRLEGSRQFLLPAQQATSCALIINELLQNAVEHGYHSRREGTILVRLDQTEDSMVVEIRDDGDGLPDGFDLDASGLGLRIVRTLVQEDLKGQFALENGDGVRALISFPRTRTEAPADAARPAASAAK
jgi:two-component system, sensor histidine kinase PdtaS